MVNYFGFILLIPLISASRTIAEQWGSEAQPKNCFTVLPDVGSIENGQKVSDWNDLQDIDKISFAHRITAFKRCFSYNNSNTLTSLALYISNPQDQTDENGQDKTISLEKIGFEYGQCQKEQVSQPFEWLEIEYTQIYGVQKITFANSEQTWQFGYEISGQAKATKRYEFSDTEVWIGLHGIESAEGIERIGVITMDSTCEPLNGVLQPLPDEETESKGTTGQESSQENSDKGEKEEVTENDEPPKKSSLTMYIVIATIASCVVIVAIVGYLLVNRIERNRKNRQGMQQLTNVIKIQKPAGDNNNDQSHQTEESHDYPQTSKKIADDERVKVSFQQDSTRVPINKVNMEQVVNASQDQIGQGGQEDEDCKKAAVLLEFVNSQFTGDRRQQPEVQVVDYDVKEASSDQVMAKLSFNGQQTKNNNEDDSSKAVSESIRTQSNIKNDKDNSSSSKNAIQNNSDAGLQILPSIRKQKTMAPPSKNQLMAMKIYNTPLPLPKLNDRQRKGASSPGTFKRQQTVRATTTSINAESFAIGGATTNLVFKMVTPTINDSEQNSRTSPPPQQLETVMSTSQKDKLNLNTANEEKLQVSSPDAQASKYKKLSLPRRHDSAGSELQHDSSVKCLSPRIRQASPHVIGFDIRQVVKPQTSSRVTRARPNQHINSWTMKAERTAGDSSILVQETGIITAKTTYILYLHLKHIHYLKNSPEKILNSQEGNAHAASLDFNFLSKKMTQTTPMSNTSTSFKKNNQSLAGKSHLPTIMHNSFLNKQINKKTNKQTHKHSQSNTQPIIALSANQR